MKITIYILCCLLANSGYCNSPNVERLNQHISDEYPARRNTLGTTSLFFGTLSVSAGLKPFSKSKSLSQRVAGGLLSVVGVARAIDGGFLLLHKEPGEALADDRKLITRDDFEASSIEARNRRHIRASSVGMSSLLYLYLYFTGDKEYQNFIYSGVLLAIVAAWQFSQESPEEQAFAAYKNQDYASSGIALNPSFFSLELLVFRQGAGLKLTVPL